MEIKQSLNDLKTKYSGENFAKCYKGIFSICRFLGNAVIDENYLIDPEFEKYIVLTEHGQVLLDQLPPLLPGCERYQLVFMIFIILCHDEVFIDVERSNIPEIERLLDEQIKNGHIKFPWIYGRLLYDKYFNEFDGGDQILESKDAQRLLADTPKGVFQHDQLIIGPLGVLKTEFSRYIPATKNFPLWHCSDSSCTKFHSVRLEEPNNVVKDISLQINNILRERRGKPWLAYYFSLFQPENYHYDYNRLEEVHVLIINAFGSSDLKNLLKILIETNSDLRSKFPKLKKLKGSAQSIVDNIDKSECFQLILLESDRKIIESLEILIESGRIEIPATEIRTSKIRSNPSGGYYDVTHQCNKLGVRSLTDRANICIVKLINLIEQIHKEDTLKEDLDWKLMNFKKDTFRETIESYVLQENPQKIIADTVIYGPRQTEKAIALLYGNFNRPQNEADKNYLVDKILWKLGFDVNIYPKTLTDFWDKLFSFREVAINADVLNDTTKEKIRSAAVNFYVLLEEVLEQSLSYITWVLLSDHFIETKFRYNFDDARNFMCGKLNGYEINKEIKLELDPSGNNNLFGLNEGFAALVGICEKHLFEGADLYRRHQEQMPHFYNKTDLTSFPFVSKLLLFDIKERDWLNLKMMSEITVKLNANNILSVRNRLEHKSRPKERSDNFPTKEEIIRACDCIEEVMKYIENNGIYPNVYLFKTMEVDTFNRRKYQLVDYRGKTIVIEPMPQYLGNKLPNIRQPQIISPIISIGNSCEPIRFRYQESSDYLKFWKHFPKKKEFKKEIAANELLTENELVQLPLG